MERNEQITKAKKLENFVSMEGAGICLACYAASNVSGISGRGQPGILNYSDIYIGQHVVELDVRGNVSVSPSSCECED